MDDLGSSTGFDETSLTLLRESIAAVLSKRCTRADVHAFIDGDAGLETDLWQQASSLGWLAVGLSDKHGGPGLGCHGLDILQTELGRYAAPGPFIATLSTIQTLADTADDGFNLEWLPKLASGEATAVIPSQLGARNVLSSAARGVAGKLRCLGSTNARILLAPVDTGQWVVIDLAGAQTSRLPTWDRTRTLFDVQLDGAKPVLTLTNGASVLDTLTRYATLLVASDSRGAAQSVADQTVAYMKAREQFGRPIASFQALKHRAADMVSRLAVIDEIVAQGVEASSTEMGTFWSALAKSEASAAFADIATDCLQLHGGVGFTWDFDPHVFLKRAKLNEQLLMTGAALRDRAASELATATRRAQTLLELASS